VSLSHVDGNILCKVRDDGSGDFTIAEFGTSQGMRIANQIANQMGGRCSWVFGRNGVEVRIALPYAAMASVGTACAPAMAPA
jgi:signal transduction histidine kinase